MSKHGKWETYSCKELMLIIEKLNQNWTDLHNYVYYMDDKYVSDEKKQQYLDRAGAACQDHEHCLHEEVQELLDNKSYKEESHPSWGSWNEEQRARVLRYRGKIQFPNPLNRLEIESRIATTGDPRHHLFYGDDDEEAMKWTKACLEKFCTDQEILDSEVYALSSEIRDWADNR